MGDDKQNHIDDEQKTNEEKIRSEDEELQGWMIWWMSK